MSSVVSLFSPLNDALEKFDCGILHAYASISYTDNRYSRKTEHVSLFRFIKEAFLGNSSSKLRVFRMTTLRVSVSLAP